MHLFNKVNDNVYFRETNSFSQPNNGDLKI